MKPSTSLYSRLTLATSVTLVVGYFVVYAAWTGILDSEVAPNATITSTLMTKIKNNLEYLSGGLANFGFSAGNVGIGTASPHAKLEISSTAPQLHVNDIDGTAGSNSVGYISFTHGASGIVHGTIQQENGLMTFDSSGGSFSFWNGNVGIGTATPQTKLDVNGPVKILRSDAIPFACDSTKVGSIYLDSDVGGNDVLCLCTYSSSSYAWRTVTAVACD